MSAVLLSLENVTTYYAQMRILEGISLQVGEGELVCLLGGSDVTALPQAQRVKRGLARTFQLNTLFRGLSVLENVCLAIGERLGVAGDIHRPAGSRRAVMDEAYGALQRLGLADDAARLVSELPSPPQ